MANLWAKVDALLTAHPKSIAAGYEGTTVFLYLLLLNKARGFEGLIPASFASPAYLAHFMNRTADAAEEIRSGMSAAAGAKLIELSADGVRIVGWDRYWGSYPSDEPEAVRERKRKSRERQRANGDNGATRDIRDIRDTVTCHEGTPRVDQSRVEESRGEVRERPGSPPDVPSDSPPDGSGESPASGAESENMAKAKPRRRVPDADSIPEQAHLVAQLLADNVMEAHPGGTLAKLQPGKRAPKLVKWADVIRRMRERDGHTWTEIQAMVDWASGDEFWRGVIQSAEGLRKNWDAMNGQRTSGRKRSGAPNTDVRVGNVAPHPHGTYGQGELEI